jgi:hypothetical protein
MDEQDELTGVFTPGYDHRKTRPGTYKGGRNPENRSH